MEEGLVLHRRERRDNLYSDHTGIARPAERRYVVDWKRGGGGE